MPRNILCPNEHPFWREITYDLHVAVIDPLNLDPEAPPDLDDLLARIRAYKAKRHAAYTLPHCVDRHSDEQCPTAATVSIDTQSNVDRHRPQLGESEPEEDEWGEDEYYDDESSDGEFDAENFEKLLCKAYMEYHGISPESEVQVITDRQPSEYCTLQPTTCEEQSETEVITSEELHQLILVAAEEGAKVRKMGAQPCIKIEELEIPLPESIGMYDKLIENLKSEILCSEESCVETPDFIKDIYNIIDESEKSATLRAIRLSTRYDEIDKNLNDLKSFLDFEEKLAAYEESIRLFDVSSLESRFNIDEILEEINNSQAVIESVTENIMFYEVKGDKVDYLIDPTKTTIDFVFSPDSFYPHMHQPHLERFKIELENVASAYYNCLLAMLWNFVCLVVCLFACNDRRRTKGALAQPFDSCD